MKDLSVRSTFVSRLNTVIPFALTIFAGAFLLFQVQPLIAKFILPWFGGSPAVWTTSMLFFQVFLLGGYIYAHLSTRFLAPQTQALVHIGLMLIALLQLPLAPSAAWQPTGAENPTWRILILLTASIGLPYLVLSATSPLLQAWFSRAHPQKEPYRLYALSNLGSLLALLSYPFLFEPVFSRLTQSTIWSVGFGIYVVACGGSAALIWMLARQDDLARPDEHEAAAPPSWADRGLWLALAATASVLLLAFTNQMTQDISAVPFLWVVPLALYLLTFIIAFENEKWYDRSLFIGLLPPTFVGVMGILFALPNASILVQVGGFSVALFVLTMFCHGELARLKPAPRYLTEYYLLISLGGALGGVFVALIAPVIFNDFYELHVGLIAVAVLMTVLFLVYDKTVLFREPPAWVWGLMIVMCVGLLGGTLHLATRSQVYVVEKTRNFYGKLAVWVQAPDTPDERLWLLHGDIYHGVQYTDPARREIPTSYFGYNSGVGLVLDSTDGPRHIGVLGMGIGTLAAYGDADDAIRFYEINPEVVRLDAAYFTYLKDSEADIDIILGDGRLSLAREESQQFDVLVLDAFAGDAVPTHLLTVEAFQTYTRHLAPGGVIAINVTNRHVDLEPVVRGVAQEMGLEAIKIVSYDGGNQTLSAEWMLLTEDSSYFEQPLFAGRGIDASEAVYEPVRLWTDDYTSLLPILR